jgi:hypothetical protein
MQQLRTDFRISWVLAPGRFSVGGCSLDSLMGFGTGLTELLASVWFFYIARRVLPSFILFNPRGAHKT